MSDPRMISADGASMTIEAAGHVSSDGYSWPDNYVLDLAHTVVEQVARIEQLDTELDAVASHSLAQGRKLRRQAAQIERVREALAWAEQAENRAHADWIRTADTHHRDAALAYTQAVTWLRYTLGDTDD